MGALGPMGAGDKLADKSSLCTLELCIIYITSTSLQGDGCSGILLNNCIEEKDVLCTCIIATINVLVLLTTTYS